MALFNAGKIDLVGMSADGTVQLFVVCDQGWDGSDGQLESFQQKIQAYVSYSVDGQMVQGNPELAGVPWCIVVDSQAGEPSARTRHVIDTLSRRLPAHGGSIELRVSSR